VWPGSPGCACASAGRKKTASNGSVFLKIAEVRNEFFMLKK
jgi:hypothetical protein